MKSYSLLVTLAISSLALASAAEAADLMVEAAPAMPAASSGSWAGPFIGAFGGYGTGTLFNEEAPPDQELNPAGWLLGVNAGVNFALGDGVVVGVVGDIAWSDLADEFSNGTGSLEGTIDWLGSLRGRVGYDGGAFLPYLTAGVAFAHNTLDIDAPPLFSGSVDATHVGWTLGAGLEIAATEDVSVDLLYRYSDYGSATYDFNNTPNEINLTAHQITLGVNFGF